MRRAPASRARERVRGGNLRRVRHFVRRNATMYETLMRLSVGLTHIYTMVKECAKLTCKHKHVGMR